MVEKIGEFFTLRGWHYRARLISETETHYIVYDFKSGNTVELLKASVEKVEWIEGE
jgi:hypothetical protein